MDNLHCARTKGVGKSLLYLCLMCNDTPFSKCTVLHTFTGYMLLAGRVRRQDECGVILEVIEKHMKRKIDVGKLFSLSKSDVVSCSMAQSILESSSLSDFNHIVWVENMQRLAVLVSQALHFGEPVLLVGETG